MVVSSWQHEFWYAIACCSFFCYIKWLQKKISKKTKRRWFGQISQFKGRMMGLGLWRPTLLLLMVLIFIVGSGLLFYQQIYLSRAEDVEPASGAASVLSDELVTSVGEQEDALTTGEKPTQVQSEDTISPPVSPPVATHQATAGASTAFLPATPSSTTSHSNSSDSSNNGNDSATTQGEQLPAGKQTPVASKSAVISASSAATVVNPALTLLVNINQSYRSKLLNGHDEVVTPMIHLGCPAGDRKSVV